MPRAEVVSTEVRFGEGPVWCPDGTLVCTSVVDGAVYRIHPETAATTLVADTGGGANAAALATDGSFVVTQNGGVDFVALGHYRKGEVAPTRWARPGLQRAFPDGRVEYLTTGPPLQMPNDLVVAADGTVYFTDPPEYGTPGLVARIAAYRPDGRTDIVATGFSYTNGIALDLDGSTLLVVDHEGLERIPDFGRGEREVLVERFGDTGADGLCLDVDGRLYVASKAANGVRVCDRDGKELDFLALDGSGFVTNCCFGGEDLRTLFATEARGNRVVAWEGMPTPGLPVHPWPAP
jgi:gluconolactonase